MNVRFFIDPQTDAPHICGRRVSEQEVEAAFEMSGQTMIEVPTELVPAVREHLAKNKTA